MAATPRIRVDFRGDDPMIGIFVNAGDPEKVSIRFANGAECDGTHIVDICLTRDQLRTLADRIAYVLEHPVDPLTDPLSFAQIDAIEGCVRAVLEEEKKSLLNRMRAVGRG